MIHVSEAGFEFDLDLDSNSEARCNPVGAIQNLFISTMPYCSFGFDTTRSDSSGTLCRKISKSGKVNPKQAGEYPACGPIKDFYRSKGPTWRHT